MAPACGQCTVAGCTGVAGQIHLRLDGYWWETWTGDHAMEDGYAAKDADYDAPGSLPARIVDLLHRDGWPMATPPIVIS